MDLIACAFRSDEMVQSVFVGVEAIVTVSLPLFSSLFGRTGIYCGASQHCWDCSMIAALQKGQ